MNRLKIWFFWLLTFGAMMWSAHLNPTLYEWTLGNLLLGVSLAFAYRTGILSGKQNEANPNSN